MVKEITKDFLEFMYQSHIHQEECIFINQDNNREAIELVLWAIDTNYRINESETIEEWLLDCDPYDCEIVNPELRDMYITRRDYPNHIFMYEEGKRIELPIRWFPFSSQQDKAYYIHSIMEVKLEFFMTKGKKMSQTSRLNRFNRYLRRLYSQREIDLYGLESLLQL